MQIDLVSSRNMVIEPSLSKGLSSPKRCSYCQKIMFFKTYRCKHCRYKCHKKCAGHSQRRRSLSSHRSMSGEEHWTKVLQANEVNSNIALPCQSQHALHHHVRSQKDSESRRKRREHRRSKSRCECKERQEEEAVLENTKKEKDTNIFTSLYDRFVTWVNSNKKDSNSNKSGPLTTTDNSVEGWRADLLQLEMTLGEHNPDSHSRCYHASISSDDSEFGSWTQTSYSSACSSLTLTSTSTASDCQGPCEGSALRNGFNSSDYYQHLIDMARSTPSQSQCTIRTETHANTNYPHPRRTKHPSMCSPSESDTKEQLCATWPPTGRRNYLKSDEQDPLVSIEDYGNDGDDEEDVDDESVFEDFEEEQLDKVKDVDIKESLGDFSIPYKDLKFKEVVREGRMSTIHRGRWHGEVMIHTFQMEQEDQIKDFWDRVSQLSMLRHENIALFMGASLEPPNLAVITSVRKGSSLYEHIHLKSEKMSMHTRVNIVRQLAQGLGYLHAKGIVMKKLNTKNISIEPKVKLCLLDCGMSEPKYDRKGLSSVARGHLTYVAPEMISKLKIDGPKLSATVSFTNKTDIFAFGSVLFELLSGVFPFHGNHTTPEMIIYQVATGKRQQLHHLRCNSTLKALIEKSWSQNPEERPEFSEINSELQHNTALHKRHSSSEPERLNRSGLGKVGPVFA